MAHGEIENCGFGGGNGPRGGYGYADQKNGDCIAEEHPTHLRQ